MSIQQGVNQLLGISAGALRLSPNFEKNVELRKLNKQEIALGKQRELQESVGKTVISNDLEKREALHNIISEQAEVAQKQFELDPSDKSYQKYSSARKAATQSLVETEMLRERKERAFARVREKGQSQVEQNTRFKELQKSLSKDEDFSRLGKYAQDYITKELLKEDK